MSSWKLVVEICLPIPIVLLFFLSVPFPKFFRRHVLRVTSGVMSLRLVGAFQMAHVMLCITGVAFAVTIKHTLSTAFVPSMDQPLTPNQRQLYLGQKWRSERNFWIAFLSFFSWWILFCFYNVQQKRLQLEEEVDELKNRLVVVEASAETDATEIGDSTPNNEGKKDA